MSYSWLEKTILKGGKTDKALFYRKAESMLIENDNK